MKWDRSLSGYICGDCDAVSTDALNELILPDEEVVFNSPTFKTSKTK